MKCHPCNSTNISEHIFFFFILFQNPHSWFITSSNFTIWGQIGLLKNAWTWLKSPILDENAFLMLQHERMWARSCQSGLKEMPCFMTCTTVTNLRTLDTGHFIRGRHKQRNAVLLFTAQSLSSRWQRHMAHRVVGLSISSNKRNKSIVKRNRPLCQNTHKEAWTGKSSISTSWGIITPSWMCLWGQRGLCCDACTIYWGRNVQCSWSEPWTLSQRACLKWHFAFVISNDGRIFCGDSIVEIEALDINRADSSINLVSHWKDDISICDRTHKKTLLIVSLYSNAFINGGALHMCFRSNHKSEEYFNFCKKIIYSSMSLYKVCSKKRIFVPWHRVIVKAKERERGVESSSSREKLFLIQMDGAKVGAKESGHHAACNHLSKQQWTHVFVRDQGRVQMLLNGADRLNHHLQN